MMESSHRRLGRHGMSQSRGGFLDSGLGFSVPGWLWLGHGNFLLSSLELNVTGCCIEWALSVGAREMMGLRCGLMRELTAMR